MPADRFLIAPLNSGLVTDVSPWMIPEDAFVRLENAYVHKGIVRKRFGSRLMGDGDQLKSRLRINLGPTDGAADPNPGDITVTVPGVIRKIGQQFSVADEIFTVVALGTPANLISTGITGTKTFDTTSGQLILHTPHLNTAVYFYPSEPVMGFVRYERNAVNNNPIYAFDTQFSYRYSGGAWERVGTTVWHSSNSQFFHTTNWIGTFSSDLNMFTTNYRYTIGVPGANDDQMKAFTGAAWVDFIPVFDVTAPATVNGYVKTARIIVAFKGRLLLLNTIENTGAAPGTNAKHGNRCRYSHAGSPFPADGTTRSGAWLNPNEEWTVGADKSYGDGAGFVDCPTTQEIISAEFIRDRLIVFFERSTWEIVYTGNPSVPFVWQKINTEVGSESPRSTVAFDRAVITVGATGIHSCTGATVERIDEKIDKEVFEVSNDQDHLMMVCGIREYYDDLVYWSVPTTSAVEYADTYPNKVLVLNYENQSFGINDDCITAFGYFEQQTGMTWSSATFSWESSTAHWDSGTFKADERRVVGGNQQGFVFIIDTETSKNANAMQITNMSGTTVTIVDHMLQTGDFIHIYDDSGISVNIFKVNDVTNANTVTLDYDFGSPYAGAYTAARVSQIDILSKEWNFYNQAGTNVSIPKIDFSVMRTTNGEVSLECYPSSADIPTFEDAYVSGSILGDGTLETKPYTIIPYETKQDRLWHSAYLSAEGEVVQLRIYLSDDQMEDVGIANSDFRLEGILIYAQKTSSRFQ